MGPQVRKATLVTRGAIRDAALAKFSQHGYSGTTLQDIGDEVGLTRGAVLHHFNSKADLLAAVVNPWLAALDHALTDARVSDPPTPADQQRLLRRFADLALDHRATVELLSSDVGARDALGSSDTWAAPPSRHDAWTARIHRLTTLLTGSGASAIDRARATAAVGAILHPAASGWLDLGTRQARAAVINAALGVQVAVLERTASGT